MPHYHRVHIVKVSVLHVYETEPAKKVLQAIGRLKESKGGERWFGFRALGKSFRGSPEKRQLLFHTLICLLFFKA